MCPFAKSDHIEFRKPHQLVSEATEHFIMTYRGWDAFERAHGGPDIIDFDLSTFEGLASFNSRREILFELSKLYDQLDGTANEEEFLRSRVRGSIAYLRALMGQQIPFPEYLEHTLGLVPVPFSDEEVENARAAVIEYLAPFDLILRVEDRERFERKLLIHDANEIRKGIIGHQELWLRRLRDTGIPVPADLYFSVQFTQVDAYWSNWISGSVQKGITLNINLHARKRYDKGRPLVLCLHEICGHAVQMSIWRDLIAEGRLNPACGLTTVHSPEMLANEGLGQVVSELLTDDWVFPPEFHLSRALQYYTLVILHNAHLMLYEQAPVENIIDYIIDCLPLADPDTIDYEIRDRGTSPLFRSYQLSYAIGEQTMMRLIQGLKLPQKRAFFLELYTRPLTPMQLSQLADAVSS
ncbi:MAG TPA: hypothetical protein VG759_05575 [Candidatus Angelobacter sp.]|jgi:hypothetical protein|nr:hypothetical protein [Candidatus Angelobacter sp.]